MKEITVRRPVIWRSEDLTNVGLVRDLNEDSVLSESHKNLWAVADGMGGYEAGNVASQMVVASLTQIKAIQSLNEWVNKVEDNLIDVNQRILEYADIMLDGRTLGSTVVSLSIKGRVGVCLWAGDSRLYRLRNKKLMQLSRDHSQIQEQIQQGYMTAEQAENHPDSNVITRAVGAHRQLYVDINVFSAQLGDVFLLCSDGLYNMVNKEVLIEVLISLPIEEAIETLMQLALDAGGIDNISIILVKGEQGRFSRPPEQDVK
ncbi:MAG: serine/threonine-protein phosphatase [Gammaproteobacteria bacterium]|nr:serine/threonine-protein phosphatase [Gammaproteobacteria bacterium]